MNKTKEAKTTQKLGGTRTRDKDSGQGDNDSGVHKTSNFRRERWSEEAVFEESLEGGEVPVMSRNRNKDKSDEVGEVDDLYANVDRGE